MYNLGTADKCNIFKAKPSVNKIKEMFTSCPNRKEHILREQKRDETKNKIERVTKYPIIIHGESWGQRTR